MNPRARAAVVVVVLAALTGIVLLSQGGSGTGNTPQAFPTTTRSAPLPPGCIEDPPSREPMPSWFPRSMPLPEGSYVHDVPSEIAPGVQVAQLFMPVSLDDFVRLVLDTWEDAGWTPGIGEREPGEAEDTFTGPDDRYGQFRAQSVYCDTNATNLYIAFASREPSPS